MSIRFVRPSEVIIRLKTIRTALSLTTADFQIFGSAEFDKASESRNFTTGTAPIVMYVMQANSTSNLLHEQAGGESVVTHGIDIALFIRADDMRGQAADEKAVLYKELIIRALYGFEPWSGASLLYYAGDSFQRFANVSDYARVFSFTQSVYIQREDIWGDGIYDDLDDFVTQFTTMNIDAPPVGDVSDDLETTITLQ